MVITRLSLYKKLGFIGRSTIGRTDPLNLQKENDTYKRNIHQSFGLGQHQHNLNDSESGFFSTIETVKKSENRSVLRGARLELKPVEILLERPHNSMLKSVGKFKLKKFETLLR